MLEEENKLNVFFYCNEKFLKTKFNHLLVSVADDLVNVTVRFALLTFLLQPLLDKSFP